MSPQHGQQLYRHIYLICKEESNVQAHYEALYSMLMLISIELANEEVMVDLIRLVLAVQVGRGEAGVLLALSAGGGGRAGMRWEGASGRGLVLELGSLRKRGASASPALSFSHHCGIWGQTSVALAASETLQTRAPKVGMFAGQVMPRGGRGPLRDLVRPHLMGLHLCCRRSLRSTRIT